MFDGGGKTLLFCLLLVAGVANLASQSRAPQPHVAVSLEGAVLPALPVGGAVSQTPLQTEVPAQTIALGGGFYATLLHGYVISGRVVTRRTYSRDATSAVSPLDLGIVWGNLAGADMAGLVSYSTAARGVRYRSAPGATLPQDWETQITNNHLIPGSDALREALLDVEVGQFVRISGYLVNVTGDAIIPWRSSTRRNDNSFSRGCEIILVTGVTIIPDQEGAENLASSQ